MCMCQRQPWPFVMQDFLGLKDGPFSSKAQKNNVMRLKAEQFHHRLNTERSRTSQHSRGPPPRTLGTAWGADDAVDV